MSLLAMATRMGDCRARMREAAEDLSRAAAMLARQVDLPAPDLAQIAEARMLQALAWGVFNASVADLHKLQVVHRALQAGSRLRLVCGDEAG